MPRKANKTARKGRLSHAEKAALEAVPADMPVDRAAMHLSKVLGRSEAALKAAIIEARERLVDRAPQYADLHMKAAKKAASRGDARPAEWALTHLTSPDGERVIEPLAHAATGPSGLMVNILMPQNGLGGAKSLPVNGLPAIEAQTVESDG